MGANGLCRGVPEGCAVGPARCSGAGFVSRALRLLPSERASYYGDIASLAREEPDEAHCRITLFSATDLDARSPGGGIGAVPRSVSPAQRRLRPGPGLCQGSVLKALLCPKQGLPPTSSRAPRGESCPPPPARR